MYINKGIALEEISCCKEAIEDYNKAIEILEKLQKNPDIEFTPYMKDNLGWAYTNKANIVNKLGLTDEAKIYL